MEKGEKVCLLGRNGEGKTTLLRLISGEMEPDSGVITLQKGTTVAGLSQALPSALSGSVYEVVAGGLAGDESNPGTEPGWGVRRRVEPVLTRLSLDAEVRFETLSVGLMRRVLLARALVAEPDILLLDEPTNDLDVETLELLEERLLGYSGTILLVSHGREFLNNVVTSTFVFEEGGVVREYAGGYDDWLSQRPKPADQRESDGACTMSRPKPEKKRAKRDGPRKLTFKEGKELDALPLRIEGLEQEQNGLYELMADPEFYRGAGERISRARARIDELGQELKEAYGRWEELESIKDAKP